MPRLPEILDRDSLPLEEQDAYDYILTTRGAVRGGLAVLLHSPEVAERVAHVGTFVRFESSLPQNVRELAALTTATELNGSYEMAAHSRNARANGIAEATVVAVETGAPLPAGTDADEVLAVATARQLLRGDHRLSDATFDAARQRYGDAGVVELLATVGYYAMVCCMFNGLEVFGEQAAR